MTSMSISEFVAVQQPKIPFTVMLLYADNVLNAKKLYTVVDMYVEDGILMARMLEYPYPIEYKPDRYQWIKVHPPN